jgi:Raf kinase inhibitor-like YbhB/YbcL family protein
MRYVLAVLILLAIILAAGCAQVDRDEQERETPVPNETISLKSSAFSAGSAIPVQYTCDGADISPDLIWSGVPGEADSLVLIMDDPDAPRGTFTHWIVYNIPPERSQLPQDVPDSDTLSDGSRQGINGFGKTGYGGPCPPKGSQHRYVFRLYAVDTVLDPSGQVDRPVLENALAGHVIAQGELPGTYQRT